MAFITAYFDESYASPNPTVYTVAGYISTDRRWIKWQKRWKKTLEREVLEKWRKVYGPDKPLAFHMTEFDNPHDKVYGDWPKEKKKNFLKELHSITKTCYQRSFSTSVIVADYNRLTDEEKFAVGSPHVCAAINCVKQVAMWANGQLIYETILYVFEKGTVDDRELHRLFNVDIDNEKREYYRVEKFAFDNKINMPPLQSADSLAYETRKEIGRIIDTANTRNARASILNLAVPMLDEWVFLDTNEFRNIFNSAKAREMMETQRYKDAVAAAKKQ